MKKNKLKFILIIFPLLAIYSLVGRHGAYPCQSEIQKEKAFIDHEIFFYISGAHTEYENAIKLGNLAQKSPNSDTTEYETAVESIREAAMNATFSYIFLLDLGDFNNADEQFHYNKNYLTKIHQGLVNILEINRINLNKLDTIGLTSSNADMKHIIDHTGYIIFNINTMISSILKILDKCYL